MALRTMAAAVIGLGFAGVSTADDLDPALPVYEPTTGVSGSIKSIGSDTMNNLMTGWGETFQQFYPAVQVEVEGKGSSTAPPALISGTAVFGPMSRPMKSAEEAAFQETFGYQPTVLRTGIDCLAVFVHRDCPLDEIDLAQVEEIFAKDGTINTWGDLGVTDPAWKNEQISLQGRNSASGTYGFFKSNALAGRDYRDSVKESAGSSGVIQAIGSEKFAMGYSGIGYATPGVKPLRISMDSGEAFAPVGENALSGDYPLARFLLIYINKDPRQALDPLRAEFAKLMFSRQGQDIVLKYNYIPLPASIAMAELEKLGLADSTGSQSGE